MCGIAGYSLHPRSSLERTLGAQALLAAIAERGADAVGYAYRSPGETYPTVVKQRTPASQLLERVSVPATATQLLVHVRDYTKGHPSIAANNHPVRHGPVVGHPQRDHHERRRAARPPLLRPLRAADDRRLGGDLRDRRPLPERRARARAPARRDGDRLGRRARADAALPRARHGPSDVGRRGP